MIKRTTKAGDVISVGRDYFYVKNLYGHFGVYVGNNRVVHFTALGVMEIDGKKSLCSKMILRCSLPGACTA